MISYRFEKMICNWYLELKFMIFPEIQLDFLELLTSIKFYFFFRLLFVLSINFMVYVWFGTLATG